MVRNLFRGVAAEQQTAVIEHPNAEGRRALSQILQVDLGFVDVEGLSQEREQGVFRAAGVLAVWQKVGYIEVAIRGGMTRGSRAVQEQR